MRHYAVSRFASFLSGEVPREEFYIFTGSGSTQQIQDHQRAFEASFGGYCC
jgi:hypothetical protein